MVRLAPKREGWGNMLIVCLEEKFTKEVVGQQFFGILSKIFNIKKDIIFSPIKC